MKNLLVSITLVLCGTALLLGAGGPVPPQPQIVSSSSSGVAGANGQVQFNNNGAFGATSGLSFTSASNTLNVNTGASQNGTVNIGGGGGVGTINLGGAAGSIQVPITTNATGNGFLVISTGFLSSTFANLPSTAPNGAVYGCSDCTTASNPCTGSSTGALAVRQNGAWVCK